MLAHLVVPGLGCGLQDPLPDQGSSLGSVHPEQSLGCWTTRAVPHIYMFLLVNNLKFKAINSTCVLVHAVFSKIALLFSVYKSSKLIIFYLI